MTPYKWTVSHKPTQTEKRLSDFDVIGFEEAVKNGMPLKEAYKEFGINQFRIDDEYRASLAEASHWARMMSDKEPYAMNMHALEIAVLGDCVYNGLRGKNHWKNRRRTAMSL